MFKFLKKINLGLKDKEMIYQYTHWHYEQNNKQIQYILALTGIIYILMGLVNLSTFSSDNYSMLVFIQLFLIPSYAFFISYLAYKKATFSSLETLLFLAPIFTVLIHTFLFPNMSSYSTYQTELYLLIFWTLTISGLRLEKAIIASFIVFIIGILYPYFFFQDHESAFILHTMWMSISILFGTVGGFLIYQSNKETFKKEKELQHLATVDTLTGLNNRHYLTKYSDTAFASAKRHKEEISIIICDIDHFKEVNDTYGHLTGDKVIQAFASLLQENKRTEDLTARYGGEEFVMVLPKCNALSAKDKAEKIRIALCKMEIEGIKITASFGVAQMTSLHKDFEDILKDADEALYRAKKNGRNQVIVNNH